MCTRGTVYRRLLQEQQVKLGAEPLAGTVAGAEGTHKDSSAAMHHFRGANTACSPQTLGIPVPVPWVVSHQWVACTPGLLILESAVQLPAGTGCLASTSQPL